MVLEPEEVLIAMPEIQGSASTSQEISITSTEKSASSRLMISPIMESPMDVNNSDSPPRRAWVMAALAAGPPICVS